MAIYQAYRGYLIRSTLAGQLFVVKDGVHICYAETLEQAKQAIDMLVS